MRRIQRHQSRTGLARPGRQRGARRVDAAAGIDLFLAVVRNVVNKAAHRGVRHQAGCGHAFVDDMRLNRFLHQGLAAFAGPLAADVAVHEELSRNDVQSLAHVLANTHHGLAAAARRVLWLVVVFHPLEMIRQSLTLGLAALVGVGGVGGVARVLGCSL